MSQAFASALVKMNWKEKTITIKAHLVFSGEVENPIYAINSFEEIQRMWTETPTESWHFQKYFKVIFDLSYSFEGQMLNNPTSCAYNYIEIGHKLPEIGVSYYKHNGAQYGYFYTGDDLGNSTTAAHEFGHALMLDHLPTDQRKANTPGIMFAKGTFVKPEFQYASTSFHDQPTLDPIHRKVTSSDIKRIFLVNRFPFITGGMTFCLGDGELLEP